MTTKERYESAKEIYAKIGVDTDKAMEILKNIPISMHCWQGDDVVGFDQDGPLTGGIQTTGDYPGRARTPQELMQDIDEALKLIAEKENLEPSDEEYEEEIADLAESAGTDDVDAFKEQYGEDVLRDSVLRQTVLDYLVDNCIQVEESTESE